MLYSIFKNMILTILDEHMGEFTDAIVDYIMEMYKVSPRNFSYTINMDTSKSKVYDIENNTLVDMACDQMEAYNMTHVHCHMSPFTYCTQPEILTAVFIHLYVPDPYNIRVNLFRTLKEWLPQIAWPLIHVSLVPRDIDFLHYNAYIIDLSLDFCKNILKQQNIENATGVPLYEINFRIINVQYMQYNLMLDGPNNLHMNENIGDDDEEEEEKEEVYDNNNSSNKCFALTPEALNVLCSNNTNIAEIIGTKYLHNIEQSYYFVCDTKESKVYSSLKERENLILLKVVGSDDSNVSDIIDEKKHTFETIIEIYNCPLTFSSIQHGASISCKIQEKSKITQKKEEQNQT